MKKKVFYAVFTLIWVGVIFSFSLQPGDKSGDMSMSALVNIIEIFVPDIAERLESIPQEQLDTWHLLLRKCAHFTEYFILGLLSTLTMMQTEMRRRCKGISALCFCVCVAAIDETIQLFVSGRAGSVLDVLIDGMGALMGILVIMGIIFRN